MTIGKEPINETDRNAMNTEKVFESENVNELENDTHSKLET